MKTHAIIPIFIPHKGCPNDCIFCNQKVITACQEPPSDSQVIHTIETYLSTLADNPNIIEKEIAFFGGSFTGITIEEQLRYLAIAQDYKSKGLVNKIHLSTRPDYIDERILDNLKKHGVDIIELGVQSFDEEVLARSNRGHSRDIILKSSEMIHQYGFTLGIQLMIGLPGDTYEKAIESAKQTVILRPAIARLYPVVILENTELARLYEKGLYPLLPEDQAVETTKEMYKILITADIKVIRVGLKSTDYINTGSSSVFGGYHPAFRQLVEGALAREQLEQQLQEQLAQFPDLRRFDFVASAKDFSVLIGQNGRNKKFFADKYPHLSIKYKIGSELEPMKFQCKPFYHL